MIISFSLDLYIYPLGDFLLSIRNIQCNLKRCQQTFRFFAVFIDVISPAIKDFLFYCFYKANKECENLYCFQADALHARVVYRSKFSEQ